MGKVREVGKLMSFNLGTLIRFSLLYKVMCSLFMAPLCSFSFTFIMRTMGFGYLTFENLGSFLLSPLTLLFLFPLVMLASFFAMVDIGGTIFVLERSRERVRTGVGETMAFAFSNAFRVWRGRNAALVFTVLLIMPFLNSGMASGFLSTLSLPEFIADYIAKSGVLSLFLALLVTLLSVLMMRWLYAFHYFTLENLPFREAARKSRELGRKRMWKDYFFLLRVQIVFGLVSLFVVLLSIAAVALIGNTLRDVFLFHWLATTAVWVAVIASITSLIVLSTALSYGSVSVLFYSHKSGKGEEIIPLPPPAARKKRKGMRIAFDIIFLFLSLLLGFLLVTGRISSDIEYVRPTEITAHRGASALFPENTMAAFRAAADMGADWVELDVQQSADGTIIVIHDSNLRRTTGKDANVWEMEWKDIRELSAGSFFSPDFAGERIPLLSDVVSFARERGLKLNIELKPTGHERDFEKAVVDTVREEGMMEMCVFTSLSYPVLERIKAYDSDARTAYVTSFLYGDITELDAADAFSVEASSITKSLVSRIHSAGKEVFAWTVNTEENINSVISMGVDNIITDDAELAEKCIRESRYSSLFQEFLKLLK